MPDPSPRTTLGRLGRHVAISACLAALGGGLLCTPARAESVSSLQAKAAAAAAQAQAAKAKADAAAQKVSAAQSAAAAASQRVGQASSQVQGSQQDVSTAGVVLSASEQKLTDAQKVLFDTRQQLQAARDYDAQLAADLAAAQDALAEARAAVVAGQAEVDAQRRVLGDAARVQFQQQSPMEGLATVVGAQSPTDLAQRLQWTDTIFDTQVADQARLDFAQVQLKAARDLQAQIEARVAAAKDAAAAQVLIVADLEKKATAQEATVAALVEENRASLLAAQKQLAADQSVLGQAQGAQASATQALDSARGELSASTDSYAQSLAASKELEQAVKNAIAQQKASAAAAESSSSAVGHGTVSASGFIRPIDADPGSPFGLRFHPILRVWMMHEGVDFGAACGTPIYAARSGTVIEARMTMYSGLYTVIGHGTISGVYVTTGYAHQSRSLVRVGQQVTRGQVIGYVGNTGLSTECHLHLEVRHDGTAVNPMKYVP